ncbi:MAG: hypothetical protein ACK5B9_03685 [Flavobacteriia bacterium]
MIKLVCLFLAGIFLFSCANNFPLPDVSPEETVEGIDIPILVEVDDKTFPIDWQTKEINATGVNLDTAEIARSIKIIKKALKKYPAEVLRKNLVKVYVLKSIEFYGVGYGGTNSTNALYLTNDGEKNGYTDEYLEKTFHHEFSSILLRNYPEFFPLEQWNTVNNDSYQDESGGVEAIRSNEAGTEFDENLMLKGFLFQYAMTDYENDLNSFAENLFCPKKDFLNFVEKYPRIYKKYNYVKEFYKKIDSSFDDAFFERLK